MWVAGIDPQLAKIGNGDAGVRQRQRQVLRPGDALPEGYRIDHHRVINTGVSA